MSKNNSFKSIFIIFILIIPLSNPFKISGSKKNKNLKSKSTTIIQDVIQPQNEDSIIDEDTEFHYYDEYDKYIDRKNFGIKILKVFEQFNINKETKITKEKLKEIFIFLFNEDSEQSKDKNEMTVKEKRDKDLQDNFLEITFEKLISNIKEEDITYDKVEDILAPDKVGIIMDDFFSQLPLMNMGELWRKES